MPAPTTLANVSICSRPAAAAAGTDVLETTAHDDPIGAAGGGSGNGEGGVAGTNAPTGTSTSGSSPRAGQASGAAESGVGGSTRSAPPPLPLPDELNYRSPATVPTLCYNSALKTMEWTTKLLFQTQLQPQPHAANAHHSESSNAVGSSGGGGSGGGAANGSSSVAAHSLGRARMREPVESGVALYSPAEAIDFALLAFPRCTFVFYFAEYATTSSSCYDVVIRPANHNAFIHRSAQVTTMSRFHDKGILSRVASKPPPAETRGATEARNSILMSNAGSTTEFPTHSETAIPAPGDGKATAAANPMLATHPFGSSNSSRNRSHGGQRLTGKQLTRALSEDNVARFNDLHDELWVPVTSGLRRAKLSLEDAECLIIVADPTLINAPFTALLPSPDHCLPGDPQEPLGLQVATLVTPSLSHLVHHGLTRRDGRDDHFAPLTATSLPAGMRGRSLHAHAHHRHRFHSPSHARGTVVNTILLSDNDNDTYGNGEGRRKTTNTSPLPPLVAASLASGDRPPGGSHPVAHVGANEAQRSSRSASVVLTSANTAAEGLGSSGRLTQSQSKQTPPEADDVELPVDPFADLLAHHDRRRTAATAAVALGDGFDEELASGDSSSSYSFAASSSVSGDVLEVSGHEPSAKEAAEAEERSSAPDHGGTRCSRSDRAATRGHTRRDDDSARDSEDSEDEEGVFGANWVIHRGCTRKEFFRSFRDPNSRIVMVLSAPVNGMTHVADGFVGLQDLCTYFQRQSTSAPSAHSGSATSSNHTSPARRRSAVIPGSSVASLSGTASPRRGSTGGAALINPSSGGGDVHGPSQEPQRQPPSLVSSLAHLDLLVSAVDRGAAPVATELSFAASACLQLGCPRVLRVDSITGTSLSREHKEFIMLYLRNVEKVRRWHMAFPYALALRMTMTTAVREKGWPATVWGAFTLVGAP